MTDPVKRAYSLANVKPMGLLLRRTTYKQTKLAMLAKISSSTANEIVPSDLEVDESESVSSKASDKDENKPKKTP